MTLFAPTTIVYCKDEDLMTDVLISDLSANALISNKAAMLSLIEKLLIYLVQQMQNLF